MPYTLHFEETSRVLLVRFEGVVTIGDLERLRVDTVAFAKLHGNCDGIADFTAVTKAAVETIYLRTLGSRERVMKGGRRVLVAPSAEVFGLSRMYGVRQSDATGEELLVVRTLDEAHELLELRSPRFVPLDL